MKSYVDGVPDRSYATTDALDAETMNARIWNGFHFRTAMTDGNALGHAVADTVATHPSSRPTEPLSLVGCVLSEPRTRSWMGRSSVRSALSDNPRAADCGLHVPVLAQPDDRDDPPPPRVLERAVHRPPTHQVRGVRGCFRRSHSSPDIGRPRTRAREPSTASSKRRPRMVPRVDRPVRKGHADNPPYRHPCRVLQALLHGVIHGGGAAGCVSSSLVVGRVTPRRCRRGGIRRRRGGRPELGQSQRSQRRGIRRSAVQLAVLRSLPPQPAGGAADDRIVGEQSEPDQLTE